MAAGISISAALDHADVQLDDIVDMWRAACMSDPLLGNRDGAGDETFVRGVTAALRMPQPIEDGPDDDLRVTAVDYSVHPASIDRAYHEVMHLATVLDDYLRPRVDDDDAVELDRRLRIATGWTSLVIAGSFTVVERREALRDPLTALLTRRVLEEELERAIAYRQEGESVVIGFLDMDGLKEINDRDGHDAGDVAIREVAQDLVAGKDDDDEAYRWGGDEFVILVRGQSREHAIDHLERVLARGRHAVSWGAASVPDDATESGELLRLADREMYLMKSRRKGGVVVCLFDCLRRARDRRARGYAGSKARSQTSHGSLPGRLDSGQRGDGG